MLVNKQALQRCNAHDGMYITTCKSAIALQCNVYAIIGVFNTACVYTPSICMHVSRVHAHETYNGIASRLCVHNVYQYMHVIHYGY